MQTRPLLAMLLLPTALIAQTPRRVDGNRIHSDRLPAAVLAVAGDLQYAGTQSFDLYGVAAVEQHFFVDLDGRRVKRLLWIQFEGYHANNSHTYDYSRDSTITHAGQSWHRRFDTWRTERPSRPGSDGGKMLEFIAAKGWTIGAELGYERLVWLLDQPARNELMVIYADDLADHGLTVADFQAGGPQADVAASFREALHQRATASFRVE